MESPPVIRSRSNALLKRAAAAALGRSSEHVVLEGDRLVDDALAAGIELEALLVSEEREERAADLEGRGLPVRRVDAAELRRVSALETSPGILALGPRPIPAPLEALTAGRSRRVLVVAGLQDPGNLGALARSAEAAGFDALACLPGGARPYGPKALRGSMGSLLRLVVCEPGSVEETVAQLDREGFRQLRAATRGGRDWRELDVIGPVAVWVGGETGDAALERAELEPVTIPMAGRVESLNVTVATSLLLFAVGGDR